jgi:hypothetical protein
MICKGLPVTESVIELLLSQDSSDSADTQNVTLTCDNLAPAPRTRQSVSSFVIVIDSMAFGRRTRSGVRQHSDLRR